MNAFEGPLLEMFGNRCTKMISAAYDCSPSQIQCHKPEHT